MKEAPTSPSSLFPAPDEADKVLPKAHYHGHRGRLRERFLSTDGAGLADYELLELLLCGFIPRKDVKPLAKVLLETFGSLSGVFAAHANVLKKVDGVGEALAVYLKAVHELHLRSSKETITKRENLSSWSRVQEYVKLRLQHRETEFFHVLFLDRKNCLIADEELGKGTVDHAPVYPREIAKRVLELSASSVILVHNHPSGDPTPSRADVSMTREVIDILDAIDVPVHDHLVVAKQGVTSMKATGLI
jgi:DNA repair protein RadC